MNHTKILRSEKETTPFYNMLCRIKWYTNSIQISAKSQVGCILWSKDSTMLSVSVEGEILTATFKGRWILLDIVRLGPFCQTLTPLHNSKIHKYAPKLLLQTPLPSLVRSPCPCCPTMKYSLELYGKSQPKL